MELRVNRKFYMLEGTGPKGSLTLFDNIEEGAQAVGQWIKKEGSSKGLSFCEVQVEGEEVSVTGVPWATLTELLVRGTKK